MDLPSKGSLSDSGFIQLLLDATESKLTGMVRLESGPVIKVVYFQQGSVAFASSNEKTDRLTEVLKRAGKLTPEQIEHAQARLRPNVSLGKTLVELGYINPKDLLWGARMQVEGILHQLLFWDKGSYQIIEGPLPREIVSLNMPVPQIILEGILKSRDRHWVLQQIGSPESVFQTDAAFHEKNAQHKLPVEEIVSRMNGKRTLNEIAHATGQDAFEVCKTVAALKILGMAQKVPEMATAVPLMVAEEALQQEVVTMPEIAPIASKQDLSLGQVLQIPTVEELQQESEEEPEPTIIVAPKQPPVAPPSIPEPVEEPPSRLFPIVKPAAERLTPPAPEPPAAPIRPAIRADEEEDTESMLERVTAPKPAAVERPAPKQPERTQRIQPPTFGKREEPAPLKSNVSRRQPPRIRAYDSGSTWKKIALAAGLVVILGAAGALYFTQYFQSPQTPVNPPRPKIAPETKQEPKPQQAPEGQPSSQKETTTVPPARVPAPTPTPPATKAPATTKPASAPAAAAASTPLGLAKSGKMSEAASAWKKTLLPKRSRFTIQLEIACLDSTVLEALQILNDSPKVTVVPLDYKGKACYRVLYGVYLTAVEANADRSRLPQDFLKQASPATVIPLAKALK